MFDAQFLTEPKEQRNKTASFETCRNFRCLYRFRRRKCCILHPFAIVCVCLCRHTILQVTSMSARSINFRCFYFFKSVYKSLPANDSIMPLRIVLVFHCFWSSKKCNYIYNKWEWCDIHSLIVVLPMRGGENFQLENYLATIIFNWISA